MVAKFPSKTLVDVMTKNTFCNFILGKNLSSDYYGRSFWQINATAKCTEFDLLDRRLKSNQLNAFLKLPVIKYKIIKYLL